MAKRTNNHMAFKDFEEKATEFISLTFDYCEDQLRHVGSHHSLPKHPKSQVLPYAAMSVQQSIKAFLAIMKMPIQSIEHKQAVQEVIKARADLGRLGGLLKSSLADGNCHEHDLRRLLREIEAGQRELKAAAMRIR